MIRYTYIIVLILSGIFISDAKVYAQKFSAGLSLYFDYNIYHRYQQPKISSMPAHSSGQLLNLFPIGGLGLWAGKAGGSNIGLEAGIDFMPFSLSLNGYSGHGAISFPVMLRFTAPFVKNSSISPFLSLGLGPQWNKIDLFNRKISRNPDNSYFLSYCAELNLGFGAGWSYKEREIGLLSMFARVGYAGASVFTLNIGLRAKMKFKIKHGGAFKFPEKEKTFEAKTEIDTKL